MPAEQFSGKVALVTGAANGIGRAIALALAREGATVIACDVNPSEPPAGGRSFTANLADEAAQDALLHQLGPALAELDIFVHCASPRRHESETALSVTDEQWDGMLNVNLRAGFRLARAIGRAMRARKAGNMVFITSLHAYTPRNLPHYSASKAGLTMIVKEFARALGPYGVRVNAIAPGAIGGGGFQANPALARKIALGRLGTADDVANATLGLLDNRFSGYITGTTLVVDGGLALYNWLDAPEPPN